MRQFRITKYNPINRDSSGAYLLDEWTEFSDVGKLVSAREYEIVEANYIQSLKLLLSENLIRALRVVELEDYQKQSPFENERIISDGSFEQAFRSVLRSDYWCKFESKNAFVHFGYDFYSYIGVTSVSTEAINNIAKNGLFFEELNSPYI